MKVLLINSPGGYEYMPYLAIPLLKGYIECNSNHSVDHIDVNLDYNYYKWSTECCIKLKTILSSFNIENNKNLYYSTLNECLLENINNSYKSLQKKETYSDRNKVEYHLSILRSVDKLINFIDKENGYYKQLQPRKLSEIHNLIINYENSFCGKWIEKNINNYNLDDYRLIGLSITYIEQLIPSLYIAKIIKKRYPEIKILVGGTLITHFKHEFLVDNKIWNNIDYCTFYQGEDTLIKLFDNIENNNYSNMDDIAYINNNKITYTAGKSKKNKPQSIPDFSGIDSWKFPTPKPIIPILTSKGCYWGKCSYCSHYEGYGSGYYKFNNNIVIQTIKKIQTKHDIEYFYFVDEAIPYKNIHEISKQLIDDDISIKWYGEARVDRGCYSKDDLKELKDAGCIYLINGIESGNSKVLKEMNKGIDLNNVEEYLINCNKVGIGTLAMFFVGFPTESYQQAEDTYKFILKNKDILTYATIGVFSLERHTDVYNNPEKYGINLIVDKDKDYSDSVDYILSGSDQISTYNNRLKILKQLNKKYEFMDHKLTGILNRESLIFLKEMGGDKVSYTYNEDIHFITIIKKGKYKGRKAKIYILKSKIEIFTDR